MSKAASPSNTSGQPSSGKKVFDVARPGNTPAPTNSRAIDMGGQSGIKDDINGISAPSPERPVSRATNPEDTHRQLMNAKSRVIVQPTGTLNQAREAASEKAVGDTSPSSAAPKRLVDFDLSSLSGYEASSDGDEALPSNSNSSLTGTVSRPEEVIPSPAVPQAGEEAKMQPPKKFDPTAKQPSWIAAAEKDPGLGNKGSVTPPPDSLIVAEYKVDFNWRGLTIMILAFIVLVVVTFCAVMLVVKLA